MLTPVGLAVAVVVGGTIAFTHSSGNIGTSQGGGIGGGLILALPSASPPASVLAFHTSRTHQATGRDHHHHASHPRPDVAPHSLRIISTGPACYVRVTSRDGHVLVQRIIRGHQQIAFRRHGLAVVLGNAGAVRVAIHGHPGRRAGRSGQVVRFRVY